MRNHKLSIRFTLLFIVSFFTTNLMSQNIENMLGYWEGRIDAGSIEVRLWLIVEQDSLGNIVTTADAPDQDANGIAVDSLQVIGSTVSFKIPKVMGHFVGELKEDMNGIDGTWTQGLSSVALRLDRLDTRPSSRRYQEPVEPFPYMVEHVRFKNASKAIRLAGTLTLPENSYNAPAVILVSGSGPQDRDSKIMGHKPFKVIADHLSRNGVAVLRYDDRGTAESEGNFAAATSDDLATDVAAAFEYLKRRKEINPEKIGIIGHSEGGLIAPMVAALNADIAFIVLMAGPGSTGEQILYQQLELLNKAAGMSDADVKKVLKSTAKIYEIAKSDLSYKEAVVALRKQFKRKSWWMTKKMKTEKNLTEASVSVIAQQVFSDWFRRFLVVDPADYLKDVKCPVLAINGEKDLQVPPSPNLDLIEEYLRSAGNSKVEVHRLKDLNHLFQHCETGAVKEYNRIEETISPEVLEILLVFIRKLSHIKAH